MQRVLFHTHRTSPACLVVPYLGLADPAVTHTAMWSPQPPTELGAAPTFRKTKNQAPLHLNREGSPPMTSATILINLVLLPAKSKLRGLNKWYFAYSAPCGRVPPPAPPGTVETQPRPHRTTRFRIGLQTHPRPSTPTMHSDSKTSLPINRFRSILKNHEN
jgi:hypothetical protein